MTEREKLMVTLQNRINEARNKRSKTVEIFISTLVKCKELLKEQEEKEKDIQEAMHAELEGGGSTWWYVCGECHTVIATKSKYCRECGRRVIWK